MVHDLPNPTPRDAQAGRQQAGGVEPALLEPHHRRDPTIRPPLTRMTRQLTTGCQARRRQGLTPRGPGRQAVAGRGQLPQTPRPQAHDPRGTGLLHGHDPVSISSGHQRRVSVRIACEQALTISTAGALSIRALTTDAAVVVGVLGGHQQPGQQPLHHTGQRSASGQGPQQARHALRAGHGLRRRVPARRTQHPGRTTDRDTRKHTTFEHMYSIVRATTTRTLRQPPRNTGTATKTQGHRPPWLQAHEDRTDLTHPNPPKPKQTPRTSPPKPANQLG